MAVAPAWCTRSAYICAFNIFYYTLTTPSLMSSSEGAGTPPAVQFAPTAIDSLDARIIQYKYALVKLDAVVAAVDRMLGEPDQERRLVFVQYIVFLLASLFAINDAGFGPKLLLLEAFKLPKLSSVTVSQVVTHVPYDMKDVPVVPLSELPTPESAVACLKAFRKLCVVCREGYQKRLLNALREVNNDQYLTDLSALFETSFFAPLRELDLTLRCSALAIPSFALPVSPEQAALHDFAEATLIDMDIYALFTLTDQVAATLGPHKALMAKYRDIKLAPKNLQDQQLKSIPGHAYSLHRILFWALRLNDVYSFIRKFGRQIYLSNYHHLHDQKFLSQMQNGGFFRTLILKDIDESFNTQKKNGVLIATITRFVRMNSKHEINAKNTLEFIGFIQQSFTSVESLTKKLRDFGMAWVAAELSFRTTHGLPTENLAKLNDALQDELAKDAKAKRERMIAMQREQRAREQTRQLQNKPAPPKPAPTRLKPTPQPAEATRGSRSSSVGSTDFVDAKEATTPTKKAPTMKPRPQSTIFLHRNGSSSSLQASVSPTGSPIDKARAVTTTAEGRRRSNSQPLSFNAAAAALKGSNGPATASSLQSPTGSIRRGNAAPKKPLAAAIMTSPLSHKTTVLNVVDEGGEDAGLKEVKLTANQKFQLHLREAQKNGALFGKQKEVLTNVVFDPNNPSGTKLRRPPKPVETPKEPVAVEAPATPEKKTVEEPAKAEPVVNQRPTRAQITKLNTQRNSVFLEVKEAESRPSGESMTESESQSSSSKASETDDSSSIKKVRFTGVPEYHPAEDAPTSQSSRILKNFAAFKMPFRGPASPLWQKDQMLKKEESLNFKQRLNPDGTPATTTPTLTASYTPPASTLKFSRFKHRF